jgi:exopolysaccharide production protein ExoQ
MIMAGHSGSITWQQAHGLIRAKPRRDAIWTEAYAWLALLPTLFITVSGRIQTDSGPVAFRFTAMEEDSLARRLTRLGCALLVLFFVSTHFHGILAACKRAKLLLLFPALAFASAVWSQNPAHTLVDATNLFLTTLFAIYLYVRYPGQRMVSFLTFAASIALLLSALAVIAFPGVGIDAFQQDAWRGVFGQRNNCATVCSLFLALALHCRPRGLTERITRGSVLFLSVVFIVMSGSRTGWIVAALAVGLTLGLRLIAHMRSLDRLAFLMSLAIPTLLLVSFVATNFTQILALMDKDPTMTQRTVIWAEVLPSIARHPLQGYGYSSFWTGLSGESMQAVLTTGWMEGQAQDGYLDVLLQLGLIGLVPLAWALMRAFKQAAGALERRVANSLVRLAIVLLPLVMVENIGESSFLLPLGIPWFYVLISLLILNFSPGRVEAA